MENPYLKGAYAPVAEELHGAELEVVDGELPRDLSGLYVRNGPNRKREAPGVYHWFDGDGMLHAVRFEDGRARYSNRWVQTRALEREDHAGQALWRGLMESTRDNPKGAPYKDTSNTDVVHFGGELVSLWYISGAAYRVGLDDLDTRGVLTDSKDAPLRMSAHSKSDPRTGELLFFDYGPTPPFMRYGVMSADRTLAHLTAIELPGPRLPHDMAITDRHVVLMDLPVFFRPEALEKKKWIVSYHPDMPARFGVLPRRGQGSEIRWFEAEPCYIYHVVNAWEDGDRVHMIACRCTDPTPAPRPEDGPLARMLANLRLHAKLHEWVFDLSTGETTERALDDLNTEFPIIDQERIGLRTRYAYHVRIPEARTLLFDGLVKYDLETGAREVAPFGEGVFGSEAGFCPREGATREDDGYVVTFVDDRARDASMVWVYRAEALASGPVAKLRVPHRVPLGFHGCFVPGFRLEASGRG